MCNLLSKYFRKQVAQLIKSYYWETHEKVAVQPPVYSPKYQCGGGGSVVLFLSSTWRKAFLLEGDVPLSRLVVLLTGRPPVLRVSRVFARCEVPPLPIGLLQLLPAPRGLIRPWVLVRCWAGGLGLGWDCLTSSTLLDCREGEPDSSMALIWPLWEPWLSLTPEHWLDSSPLQFMTRLSHSSLLNCSPNVFSNSSWTKRLRSACSISNVCCSTSLITGSVHLKDNTVYQFCCYLYCL